MTTQLDAVYEDGIFRPLQSVNLPENQRVRITIDTPGDGLESEDRALFALNPDQWQSFCEALDAPPKVIPALRQLLTEPSLFDDNGRSAS